jgi:hypothetical protein
MDAQAQIQALREQFATEMQRSTLQINTLASRLDTALSTIESLRTRTIQRKPYLPDVDKFDGVACHFDTWLPSIEAKLHVDGDALGDSTGIGQFYYVYLRLESQVQAIVLPQLRVAKETQVWDFHTILDQLARVYDSPNKVQDAEDKLFELKQGNQEAIPAYTSRFERMLYEAQGQKWSEDRKIATYRQGLLPSIRKSLRSQLDPPKDYPSYARMVLRLVGTTRPSFGSSLHTPSNTHPPIQARHDTMDLSVIEPRKQMAKRIPSSNQDDYEIGTLDLYGLDIAPLSKPRQFYSVERTPPLPTKQPYMAPIKDSYRTTGACLRCGSYDHWLADCSIPARPRSQANTSSVGTGKKVVIEAINDSSSLYDSEDSSID